MRKKFTKLFMINNPNEIINKLFFFYKIKNKLYIHNL